MTTVNFLAPKLDFADAPTIDRCGNCDFRIALRRPSPELPASPWECRCCRAVFLACPQLRDGKPFSAGTRSAYYFDVVGDFALGDSAGASEISEQDVLRLRECLAAGGQDRPESRKNRRHPILAPVMLLALSLDLRIAEGPRAAIAVNVSAGGLAIMHSQPIDQPYFAVDFSRASTSLAPVVLENLRTRPAGTAFEIAGKFLSRIEY